MLRTVLRVLVVIAVGFFSGVIGWIVGALIGGNYAEQFVFNGVQGYEATGQIGFILGALIGSIFKLAASSQKKIMIAMASENMEQEIMHELSARTS